ncbi:hypothetical protein D8S78_17005 [Natrialba swarupiae]|nr:hypothetical protein [Natrialba swarupiae]
MPRVESGETDESGSVDGPNAPKLRSRPVPPATASPSTTETVYCQSVPVNRAPSWTTALHSDLPENRDSAPTVWTLVTPRT